ncbi:MAG TPA: permease-like cell division protein FtsX [Micromonosporaceae bacterium]|jgi:cell division transport system permease protein|nr:permease-like cell division protein FtsX [Micromonosporaceae bacterium]
MRARYVLSEVFVGLWRNVTMTVAMMITMAVSLTMLGASVLMLLQVNDMKTYYYDQIQVSIFLAKDVTEQQRTALDGALKEDPIVQSYFHETKEQAYENFKVMFRDAPDLVNSVKADTLPEAFRVKLKNPEEYQKAYDKYKDYAGISDIVDQRRLLGKIFGILGALQNMALVIAIVQGVAALLLVANTIQVAAYSKRREVAVMKLVGASNWFIQAPFVLEAMVSGLIGALLAFGALVAAKVFLIDGSLKVLTELLTPVSWRNILLMLPLLAGVAAAVNAVTGWVTLRFYLRV